MRRRLVAAALLLAACDGYAFAWDSSTGTVVIGFVGNGTTVVIEAADTVQAGVAFGVTVNTFGSSSCVRAERLDVTVDGAVARLTPYDRVAPSNVACTEDFGSHPHTGTVTFATPGDAVLEAVGKAGSGDTVVRKAVVVR
jgi:hypothetical protein